MIERGLFFVYKRVRWVSGVYISVVDMIIEYGIVSLDRLGDHDVHNRGASPHDESSHRVCTQMIAGSVGQLVCTTHAPVNTVRRVPTSMMEYQE